MSKHPYMTAYAIVGGLITAAYFYFSDYFQIQKGTKEALWFAAPFLILLLGTIPAVDFIAKRIKTRKSEGR